MNFDDIIGEDTKAVFLSGDEFGKEIEIDDITITGILDDGDTREHAIKGVPDWSIGAEGRMWAEKKTLYASAADIEPIPKATQNIRVNGTHYEVESVTQEDGMAIIVMTEIGV